MTPTSCADCSTALQANLKSTTLDDAGNLQSFIKNSAAFCQRQPTSITLDGLSRPCHDSFVAAAAQVQDACFSNFNGNLFNSEVLDKVCKLACGAAYTKFTSTIQDTCASAVFGTIVLDDNPVDITLNVMFGMFSSFTNFACLKDGTDYCINSIPNRIASSGLNVFYDSNEFKVLSCSKCSEATRTLLRIKESVFAQSPGNSIIRDLVREWDGYCTVSQGSTATSTARPLPTVPSSSKRTGVTSTLVVAIICVFLFVI